jgi:hypothetical protein
MSDGVAGPGLSPARSVDLQATIVQADCTRWEDGWR